MTLAALSGLETGLLVAGATVFCTFCGWVAKTMLTVTVQLAALDRRVERNEERIDDIWPRSVTDERPSRVHREMTVERGNLNGETTEREHG